MINLGTEHRQLHLPVLTTVFVVLGGPGFDQYVLYFQQPFVGLIGIDSVAPELVEIVSRAPTDPNDNPAPADVVDQGDLLREPDGVVQGHLGHGKSNFDPMGPGGDG